MPLPRTRMRGVIPRRAQVLDRGGLSDWPVSSSKTIQPPRAAAVLLPGARSPFFHTSMAPSSRSMARRAPSWHDQPCRCSRYQIPGTVHWTPNFPATRSRTRASVHRWSCHPADSGPASSTVSSAASCASSQQAPRRLPFRRQPGHAGSFPTLRHRRTDRSLTRSSAATTATGTRCPNLSTAASRTVPGACGPQRLTATLRIPIHLIRGSGREGDCSDDRAWCTYDGPA